MAEPELMITDHDTVDAQAIVDGNESSTVAPPSHLDEEPEFELEEEFALENDAEEQRDLTNESTFAAGSEPPCDEDEFSLEEENINREQSIRESVIFEPPSNQPSSESQLLHPDFDEQTLENLLTEPKEEIPNIAEPGTASVDIDVVPSAAADMSGQIPASTMPPDKRGGYDVPEKKSNKASYSDDILTFPKSDAKPLLETGGSSVINDEDEIESSDEEKIDFTGTIEIEHTPGTLHIQQAQQIELSILERVDDLIHVLQNKSKTSAGPEQLPHKQFATGLHYIKHEKNHYLGAKWLRKAAIQGHAKAQMYLGMLFVQGKGVPKSYFHAYAWFSLAVCQDIPEAIDARKKLEPHLTAKEINASLKYAADLLDRIHL